MKNKLKFIIPIIIAVIAIIVAALCIDFTPAEKVDIPFLVSTAQKYLIENNYEQAIAEFNKIIEIDPMNVDAYIGIADAYIGIGDTEKAIEWLEKGYELTGDSRIKEMLELLTANNIAVETEVTTMTERETTATITESETTATATETTFTSTTAETTLTAAMIKVPDLAGLTEEAAVAACESIGLNYSVSYSYSDTVEKGCVMSQAIPVNSSVAEGICISFTISMGAKAVTAAATTAITTIPATTTTAVTTTTVETTTVTTVSETTKPNDEDFITIKGKQYSTSLTELDLSHMELTDEDIKPLEKMVNLTRLDLFKNQISDISPLNGLTNLTTLNLGGNQISDLSALSGLTNLTYLSLSNNQISDISALSGLTNLETLYLNYNKVSNVSALSGLSNLKKLHLAYNGKIDGLSELKQALPDCDITTYMI